MNLTWSYLDRSSLLNISTLSSWLEPPRTLRGCREHKMKLFYRRIRLIEVEHQSRLIG